MKGALSQRSQAWVREIKAVRFGHYSGLEVRSPRGWGVCAPAGHRAARRAVAAQTRGEITVAAVGIIGEEGVDPEVFRLFHDNSLNSEPLKKNAEKVRTCTTAKLLDFTKYFHRVGGKD